jgi:iron(III) transport system substrate-binding protein
MIRSKEITSNPVVMGRSQTHMTRTTGLLSIKSQSAIDQGNFKPIRLDTGLLVYLDKLKRKRFLREWSEALVQ